MEHSENFTFQQFTDSEVRSALRELKVKKATGVDGIPSRLLKDGADVLTYPLTVLFNLSVQQCKIPGEWKKAKVTPLYKNGAKSDPKNFRPISVLPIVSKVHERLIHNQLASYFDENNLLCRSQSGFRKKHSTETAVTYFADQILMGMDKGLVTGAVFIDLAKAFDTIDHDVLIHKLKHYGVCDESLLWFKDYFCARKQFVTIDSHRSEELDIACGVPQGSILGPLLFIIYINDLSSCMRSCSVSMYAHDTAIYFAASTVNVVNDNINEDLNCLTEWLKDNYLVLNITKTKCILFCSQRHGERNIALTVNLFGSCIESVTTFKYLGVVFDSHMTWKDQADHVYKKVAVRVNVLRRIRTFLTEKAAIHVYNGIILPVFDYCDITWSSLLQQDEDRLQRLQHRAARIITQSERSSEAMEKLKWSSLNCRRSYHKAILVYKCLHSLVPNYFLNYFKKFSNVHSYNTRHKNRLILPKVKYNFGKNTFIFSGVQVYNMLPDHVMKAESIHTFARLVRIVCNELSY